MATAVTAEAQAAPVALITGVGGPSGRSAVEALGARGYRTVATDMRRVEHGADMFALLPAASKPTYLPALVALVERHGVTWLFPTVAEELLLLARYAAIFRAHGVAIFVSPPEGVANCHDKWRTVQALEAAGVAVPQSALGRAGDAAVRALGFPRLSKPRIGRGGRGVTVHDGPRATPVTGELLWQRFLPGTEYDVVLMIDPDAPEAAPLAAGVFEKTRLREGRTGNALELAAADAPDVLATALAAARALGLTGPLDIDIRRDADGLPRVLEINARIGAHVLRVPALFDAATSLHRSGHLGG